MSGVADAARTLESLQVNPDWASLPLFDRTGWTRVPFGDVVENVNETVREPEAAGIERFIGLEHLEPGSLHIRSWGNIADGTTFKRRCRRGQLLFGKRRAYQRKVAVADFDALVSGDIYVLAARPGRLLPDLLPFICLSERFYRHAVGTSAGSLSPRTNWSSLATFELDLPPIEQQRQFAQLLTGASSVVSAISRARDASEAYFSERSSELFSYQHRQNVTLRSLVERGAASLQTGPFGTVLRTSSYILDGVPVVDPASMYGDDFDLNRTKFVSEAEARRLAMYQTVPGDIVICRVRHVGRMVYVRPQHAGYIVGTHCIRLRTDPEQCDSKYLDFFLRTRHVQEWLLRSTVGTVMPAINEAALKRLLVPLPSVDDQRHIAATLDALRSVTGTAEGSRRTALTLVQVICNLGFM
jgi:type I restriction enzyme, S subunit